MTDNEKIAAIAATSAAAALVITGTVVAYKKLKGDRAYDLMIDAAKADEAATKATSK